MRHTVPESCINVDFWRLRSIEQDNERQAKPWTWLAQPRPQLPAWQQGKGRGN